MAYSSYQVQRMMEHLKRSHASVDSDAVDIGLADRALDSSHGELLGEAADGIAESAASEVPVTRVVSGFDHVQLSARAIQQAAQAAALRMPAGARIPTVTIIDDSPLPLPIRIELERRAGSFMRPPLMPSPPPLPIPRARRPSHTADRVSDPLGDILGDAD